jgi:antitoxin CcdA
MKHERITSGKRKAVNLTLDTGVVATARELGLNLSQISEAALREATQQARERRWEEQHASRIDAFAAWLDEHGMPFEDLRVY